MRLIFYLLFEEDVIDEKPDFNSLECQIGNLVLSHDYHLPSRGKADNQLPSSAQIISEHFHAVKVDEMIFCGYNATVNVF